MKRDVNKRLSQNNGLHQIFLEVVARHPNKIAIIDIESSRTFTFTTLNEQANKYANFFQVVYISRLFCKKKKISFFLLNKILLNFKFF